MTNITWVNNKLFDKKSCLANKFSITRFTVLIFDSGVGGLSIYAKIREILPNLHYIYAFDNAIFPYGEKNKELIIKRVIRIVTAIQQRYSLALAIIACNTASTVSLPNLRKKFKFPIIGVVPAIKPAVNLTTNGTIGLLATHRTIECSYTHKLIKNFASGCRIKMLSSNELVLLAESKIYGENISLNLLRRILKPWLQSVDPLDTIILGCTHFPLLQNELLAVLPKGIQLIDSSTAVAYRTAWVLEHEAPNIISTEINIAYCTLFTSKTKKLLPILQHYGFKILKELIL